MDEVDVCTISFRDSNFAEDRMRPFGGVVQKIAPNETEVAFQVRFPTALHSFAFFSSTQSDGASLLRTAPMDESGWEKWRIHRDHWTFEPSIALLPAIQRSGPGQYEGDVFSRAEEIWLYDFSLPQKSYVGLDQYNLQPNGVGQWIKVAAKVAYRITRTTVQSYAASALIEHFGRKVWSNITEGHYKQREKIAQDVAYRHAALQLSSQRRTRLATLNPVDRERWRSYYHELDQLIAINR